MKNINLAMLRRWTLGVALVLLLLFLGTVYFEHYGEHGFIGVGSRLSAVLSTGLIIGLQAGVVLFWKYKVGNRLITIFLGLQFAIPCWVLTGLIGNAPMWPMEPDSCLVMTTLIGWAFGLSGIVLACLVVNLNSLLARVF